jgi:hypothetical protein
MIRFAGSIKKYVLSINIVLFKDNNYKKLKLLNFIYIISLLKFCVINLLKDL